MQPRIINVALTACFVMLVASTGHTESMVRWETTTMPPVNLTGDAQATSSEELTQSSGGLKIYISVDMEGISGISGRDQTSNNGTEYGRSRKLMADDTNAAIRGAIAAGATDQKHAGVAFTRVGTADKGVERRDAVHQPMLLKEIQCAVNGGRRSVMTIGRQFRQHVVGAQRLVGLPDQFQNSFPDGRQSGILPLANGPGVSQGLTDTGIVVVRPVGNSTGRHGRNPAKFETL